MQGCAEHVGLGRSERVGGGVVCVCVGVRVRVNVFPGGGGGGVRFARRV